MIVEFEGPTNGAMRRWALEQAGLPSQGYHKFHILSEQEPNIEYWSAGLSVFGTQIDLDHGIPSLDWL
jgi:hypothetical protein